MNYFIFIIFRNCICHYFS